MNVLDSVSANIFVKPELIDLNICFIPIWNCTKYERYNMNGSALIFLQNFPFCFVSVISSHFLSKLLTI